MQITKTVRDFINRTGTRCKHFRFCFNDGIATYSVWEVAGEFARNGGKLFNINAHELGKKFAKMMCWNDCVDVWIADGV